jgi:arsenate reductase-like glutaredoxin family protein
LLDTLQYLPESERFSAQKKIEFQERDFFKNKFSREELLDLLQGRPAGEMFNPRSPSVKSMGLYPARLTDDKLVDLMLQEPRLIRRPVVRIDNKVYFGADSKTLAKLLT